MLRWGGSQVAQVEAEEEGMITPRESGIARAVIASERRPHPAEGWVEVDIRGKRFKLGGSLGEEEPVSYTHLTLPTNREV